MKAFFLKGVSLLNGKGHAAASKARWIAGVAHCEIAALLFSVVTSDKFCYRKDGEVETATRYPLLHTPEATI